jgi:hypothetical protein
MSFHKPHFAFLSVVLFLAPLQSFAYLAKSSTELGSQYTSQHIEAESKGRHSEGPHFAGWSLSGGGSKSKDENATTGATTTVNSRDFSGDVDFGFSKEWLLSLSYDSTHSNETEYTQNTIGADISYANDPPEDGIGWNLGFGFYQGDIKQKFTIQILNRDVEREVTLSQKETQFSAGGSPIAKLSFQFRASSFTYSKSKQDLQTAFQNRFLNAHASDLISSIAGLPDSRLKLSIVYQLSENWDASVSGSQTKLIVDDSLSKRSELSATCYLKNWRLGGGVANSQSPTLSETTALVDLGYSWD